jgi:hypothetical protein
VLEVDHLAEKGTCLGRVVLDHYLVRGLLSKPILGIHIKSNIRLKYADGENILDMEAARRNLNDNVARGRVMVPGDLQGEDTGELRNINTVI